MKPKSLIRLASLPVLFSLLAACSSEPPPPTVEQLMRDEFLLDTTLVRCTVNRSETRYNPECINVREAVKLIEAREERARREELEAQSQQKREALRNTQEAVAEARRRAAEQERQREEAEYILQFGELPPTQETMDDQALTGNAPTAAVAEATEEPVEEVEFDSAGVLEVSPQQSTLAPSTSDDLRAIREELNEQNDDNN